MLYPGPQGPSLHAPAEQTESSTDGRGRRTGTAYAYHTTSRPAAPSERTRVGGDIHLSPLGFCSALAAGAAGERAIVNASLERAVNCAR